MGPKKSLGQNFLISPIPAEIITKELDIHAGDFVVEIGPGKGAVTERILIAQSTTRFDYLGIEKDDELFEFLSSKYLANFVNADALEYLHFISKNNLKLCGSLPYYAATKIMEDSCKILPTKCVFLVQYEVGLKICADAGKMNEHAALIQGFFDVKFVKKVKNTLFFPIPKVDGGIITFTRKEKQPPFDLYHSFVKTFFSKPRKMIKQVFTKSEIDRMGIDSTRRPGTFSSEEIVKAFSYLTL